MGNNPFDSGGPAEWTRKIQDIFDEMLHRDFFDYRAGGQWQPAINEYETERAFYVCVELAGMAPDGAGIALPDDHTLIISGCRDSPRPPVVGPLSIHALEIDEGCFRRQLEFSTPLDRDRVEVSYDKGYLWLRLPKKPGQ